MARQRLWPAPLGGLADLIFPPRCVGCRARGAWLCATFLEAIRAGHKASARCDVCDRVSALSPCAQCRREAEPFVVRVAGDYDGHLRDAIAALKFEGQPQIAPDLAALLVHAWRASGTFAPEAIVTVPMPPDRRRERGYNPAELLARGCGKGLGVPVWRDAVRRTRAAPPQHRLDAVARRDNVRGLFACDGPGSAHIAGRRVLMVDDVTTTGATLRAIATALTAAGASEIAGLALARPLMR